MNDPISGLPPVQYVVLDFFSGLSPLSPAIVLLMLLRLSLRGAILNYSTKTFNLVQFDLFHSIFDQPTLFPAPFFLCTRAAAGHQKQLNSLAIIFSSVCGGSESITTNGP